MQNWQHSLSRKITFNNQSKNESLFFGTRPSIDIGFGKIQQNMHDIVGATFGWGRTNLPSVFW